MGNRILVTGSNGQLGNEIRKISPQYKDLKFIFTDIEEVDITDKLDLLKFINTNRPDYIINCAGYTAVDQAEEESDTAMLVNGISVNHLVDAIKGTDCRLIQISTDYVFNRDKQIPILEGDIPQPNSVYSLSKYKGELNALKHPESMIIRTSWLYSSFGKNFVKTILRLAKERDEIGVVNDQIGSPTYAADLAAAIVKIVEKDSEGLQRFEKGIFHYANSGFCSWFEFALAIKEYKNLDLTIKPITTAEYTQAAHRPPYSVLSTDKIKKIYKLSIPNWRDSLKVCLSII